MPPRKPNSNSPVPLGMPLMDFFAHQMANNALVRGEFPVRPKSDEELAIERDRGRTEELREQCRRGNPFPLVAWQWPELVVTQPDQIPIFRENLQRVADEAVTDQVKRVCLDPSIPVLRLDWWQHLLLAATFDPAIGEIYISGGVGVGKGFSSAIAANLWYDVHESRIHLTGRDRDHARNNIFGEFAMWRSRMKHPFPGSLTSESLRYDERHYAILLNPDVSSPTAGEAFSGRHGRRTAYQFDECSALPVSFIDNAARNAYIIFALSNPRTMSGWFRQAFEQLPDMNKIGMTMGRVRMRLCMSVGGGQCLNVRYKRLKVPVAPRGGIEIDSDLHPAIG